jgi:hypothetical protein
MLILVISTKRISTLFPDDKNYHLRITGSLTKQESIVPFQNIIYKTKSNIFRIRGEIRHCGSSTANKIFRRIASAKSVKSLDKILTNLPEDQGFPDAKLHL